MKFDLEGFAFQKFIDYVYTGDCILQSVSVSSVFHLIEFADLLQLDRLRYEFSSEFLSSQKQYIKLNY